MELNQKNEHFLIQVIVYHTELISDKMDPLVKIIIIDEGSSIPKYLLKLIREILENLVIRTESLPPKDCTGILFVFFFS